MVRRHHRLPAGTRRHHIPVFGHPGWIRGKHSLKFGAEFRRFRNNNFNGGTGGTITFPSLAAFVSGVPSRTMQQTLAANPRTPRERARPLRAGRFQGELRTSP